MWWLKSKTIWTGIVAIVSALAAYFTGQAELADTLQIIFSALLGMFIRSGVEGVKQNE